MAQLKCFCETRNSLLFGPYLNRYISTLDQVGSSSKSTKMTIVDDSDLGVGATLISTPKGGRGFRTYLASGRKINVAIHFR